MLKEQLHILYWLTPKKQNILWMVYALPCLLTWSIYWIVFYPALMSYDSINQWGQIISGHFTDLHPAILTMLMWLITRVWFSPAAIVAVQILALSLTVGWGLATIYKMGVPKTYIWIASVMIAVMPFNGTMVISIWKDTPYTISFLALTILLIRVGATKGEALGTRSTVFFIGLTIGLVSLFRLNGPAVGVGSLIALLIFCRQYWRRTMIIALIAAGLWIGIRGPFYKLLHISSVGESFNARVVFAHQIAAHIAAKTPLRSQEIDSLNRIFPLDTNWNYNRYSVWSLTLDKRFNWSSFMESNSEIFRIYLALLIRNPLVNLKHTLDSSSLVWQIAQPSDAIVCGPFILTSADGKISTIDENRNGLQLRSKIPGLLPLLTRFINMSLAPKVSWLFWRSALWMYLAGIGLIWIVIRSKERRLLLVLTPVLFHSAFMAFIFVTPEMRYQYPVYLTSQFLVFLSPYALKKVENNTI
jgi:hypothetical protein